MSLEIENNRSNKFIYFFSVVFLVFSIVSVLALPFSITGNFYLYGLEGTKDTTSGMVVIALFILKGFVGYCFLTKKPYFLNLALFDAILGIIMYVGVFILQFVIRVPFQPDHRILGVDFIFLMIYLNIIWKQKLSRS